MPRDDAQTLFGVGLYTAGEAEKLIGIPSSRIRRWLAGYSYQHKGEERWSEPLWTPQLPRLGREVELGFRDLLELRFIEAFTKVGLGLPTIRRALAIAQQMTGQDHPFSTARFRTDGKTIFLQAVEETGEEEPRVIDIFRNQYGFNRIIAPSFKDVEFDAAGVAARWWPLSQARAVVLDPTRSFGQPIVADQGVPTRAIADAVEAEGSVDLVAKLFELSRKAVRDAVEFEKRMAA